MLLSITWPGLQRAAASVAGRARTVATRHPTLTAGIGYLLIVVSLFRELVFEGRVLFEQDIHLFWYTQVESLVRIVTTPVWPLWDPYTSFGQPLLADPSAQILYPPTWLNLLMRPWVYWTLFVLGHLVFSGVGAFRLARRLGIAHLGAFTAGAFWITSGPLLSLDSHYMHFAGATWLPWVLLATQRTADNVSWTRAATWGVVLAGQILAGSADMCALGLLGSAILLTRHTSLRATREICRRAGAGLVAVCVAAGLTAALLLPLLDVVSRSARRALPEAVRTAWSLHPARLLELAFPVPWQYLAANPDLSAHAFEGRDPFLHSLYLGLPTLALLLSATTTRQRGLLRTLVAIVAVGLLLALGRYLPFYGWLTILVPPLRVLRYPQKVLALVALGVALIAGLGVEAWQKRFVEGWRWARRVVLPLAALTLAVWVAFWLLTARAETVGLLLLGLPLSPGDSLPAMTLVAHHLLPACVLLSIAAALALLRSWRRLAVTTAALLACISVAELFRVHRDLNPTATPDLFRYRPSILARLPQQDRSRIYVHDYLRVKGDAQRHFGRAQPYEPARAPRGWSLLESTTLAMRDALVPPVAGAWAYESSYDIDFRGLYISCLADLTTALRSVEETPAYLRLLQVGAVRHVIALHSRGYEGLPLAATLDGFPRASIRVYEVPQPVPRVYAVDGVRVADGANAILALTDPGFDRFREIVLPQSEPVAPDVRFSGVCRIAGFRADRVRIEAELSHSGYVVLVDTFDPGWKATVDGAATPVLRANVAFRAVPVPAGRHEVVLLYRPASVFWGLGISLATLLACAAVFWRADWPQSARGAVLPMATDQSGDSRATEKTPDPLS